MSEPAHSIAFNTTTTRHPQSAEQRAQCTVEATATATATTKLYYTTATAAAEAAAK